MKRLYLLCFTALLCAAGWACVLLSPAKAVFAPQSDRRLVVIDAGHGGADGGAVSLDGSVKESTVNLQIAQRLALLLMFCGEQVTMTRCDANDLSSPESTTIRERKVSDLKNRASFVNENGADVLISIHQNSLPQHTGVSGAQVFYNAVASAGSLASAVQDALNQSINDRTKLSKAIDPSIYLMKEVRCPAILAECGFLSNSSDTQLLCSQAHQMKLSLAITAGYLLFVSEGGIP